MHDIYIEGGTKRQKDIADKVISFCLKRLMPRARSINVELTLRSMSDLGGCWLIDNHRSFGIEVNSESKTKEFIISLIHEMVHAKQYYKKELTEALNMKSIGVIVNKVYWKGEDCTDLEYKNLPCEIEAYDMQETLYKEYKKHDDTTI